MAQVTRGIVLATLIGVVVPAAGAVSLSLIPTAPDTIGAALSPFPPSASQARTASPGLSITYEEQLRQQRQWQRRPSTEAALALEGLVVDETLTPQGRRFYDAFFGVWRSPTTTGFYTVRVEEQPTPGRGTRIRVLVNDTPTFQTRLQPHTDIDDHALQAARRTYAHVRSGRGALQIQ